MQVLKGPHSVDAQSHQTHKVFGLNFAGTVLRGVFPRRVRALFAFAKPVACEVCSMKQQCAVLKYIQQQCCISGCYFRISAVWRTGLSEREITASYLGKNRGTRSATSAGVLCRLSSQIPSQIL